MCPIIPAVFQPHVLFTFGSSNTKVVTDSIQSIRTLEIYVFPLHNFKQAVYTCSLYQIKKCPNHNTFSNNGFGYCYPMHH